MRFYLLIFLFFFTQACNKPKSVLICGDHICVNKEEAKQYFEKNLSLEVKIIDKKDKKNIDLVELNLQNSSSNQRQVKIISRSDTKKKIKTLSTEEIKKIKSDLKKDNSGKKIAKKINKNKKLEQNSNLNKINKTDKLKNVNQIQEFKINTKNRKVEVVDVCTIIKNCNIEEISRYLIKQGKKKKYPNLNTK